MKTILYEIDINQNQDLFAYYEAGVPYITLTQLTEDFFQFADFGGESDYNRKLLNVSSVTVTESDGSINTYTEVNSLADLRTQNRSFYFTEQTIYLHINQYEPWWLQERLELGTVTGYSNDGYHSGSVYYPPRLRTDGLLIDYEKDPLYAGLISFKEYSFSLLNGDGALDDLATTDIYGNATRLKIGDASDDYDDFTTLFEGRVSAVPNVRFDEVEVTAQDKRKFLSRTIPTNRFNITDYPNIEDDTVGKPVPLAWGECRNIPLTPIDDYQFQICDPLTSEYGGIQSIDAVYVDGTEVTPSDSSTTDCTVTISSSDADKEFSTNVTADVHGYEDGSGVLIDNGLYVIRELLRIYADTEYIAANYNTTQWDSYETTAADISLFIEEEDLIDTIEQITLSMFGIFYAEMDGRYSFKKTDNDRGIADTIEESDIITEPRAEYDSENFLTSVTIEYNQNYNDGNFQRYHYDDLEDTIYTNYRQYRNKKYETSLKLSADALSMAEEVMDISQDIPTYFPVTVPLSDYLSTALLDNILTVINRPGGKWYGEIKAEVTRLALNLSSEQIEFTLRLMGKVDEHIARGTTNGSIRKTSGGKIRLVKLTYV